MKNLIRLSDRKELMETKDFLKLYLSQKNKGIENGYYFSIYFSLEDEGTQATRGQRINKILKEAELCIKSQLPSRVSKNIWNKFIKLRPFEVLQKASSSVVFVGNENFAGFLYIPFNVSDYVIVARSLHLKPILEWLTQDDSFYLVTLSSKKCRLLKGDSFNLVELESVELEDNEDSSREKRKLKTLKLIQSAEEKFYHFLKKDNYPIILGGVLELHKYYLQANRDPDVVGEKIIGNLDKASFLVLHQECLAILNEMRLNRKNQTVSKIKEQRAYGRVLENLHEIAMAAIQGKVKSLMIANDVNVWGTINKTTGDINSFSKKNISIPEDDVLDDLAEVVLARGGEVVLCKQRDIPSSREAVALLR
jgi:hypothetical protein